MASELFLYDREKGLFKAILNQSKVIEGRYFIVSTGFDINTTDLGALVDDQKYPCVICSVPRSTLLPPDFASETFSFILYFLTRHAHEGSGAIKDVDVNTLLSTHPTWYDWNDMKECAAGFVRKLYASIKEVKGEQGQRIAMMDKQNIYVERITKGGTDIVNGVKLSFTVMLKNDCLLSDYEDDAVITLPDLNIHPLHKL